MKPLRLTVKALPAESLPEPDQPHAEFLTPVHFPAQKAWTALHRYMWYPAEPSDFPAAAQVSAELHLTGRPFAHAAESMTCITPNPKSDCLDMEAIRLIVKWLPIAVKDPENIEARYNMMLASTFAGMGFSDALVHLGHAFSECMGAKFHVAHGISCAWGLPETMTYASKYRGDKVRMVADAMGLTVPEGATDEEVGQIVADAIREFMKGIGVRSIKESGFTREDTVSIYTSIPKNLCWPSLPQPLSDDELKAWLGRVYDTYQ